MFWYYLAQTLIFTAVLLFAAAVYSFVSIQYAYQASDPVDGTIVSVRANAPMPMSLRSAEFWNTYSTTYSPTFAYRYGGREYEVEARFASSDPEEYVVGGTRVLYVDRTQPDRFLSSHASEVYGFAGTMCFFVLLLLFFWFPLRFVFGAYETASAVPVEHLRIKGKQIFATVTLVERSATADMEDMLDDGAKTFLAETGVDPWTVYAEWQSPEDGKTYQFQSVGLTSRPRLNKGETIDVFIESGNPRRYFMDLGKHR